MLGKRLWSWHEFVNTMMLAYPKALPFRESEGSSIVIAQFHANTDLSNLGKASLLYFLFVTTQFWLIVLCIPLRQREMFEIALINISKPNSAFHLGHQVY